MGLQTRSIRVSLECLWLPRRRAPCAQARGWEQVRSPSPGRTALGTSLALSCAPQAKLALLTLQFPGISLPSTEYRLVACTPVLHT